MNIIEIYKDKIKNMLAPKNELRKYFNLIEQDNKYKILQTRRQYGKTDFIIRKAIKEAAFCNKKVLILTHNNAQKRMLMSKINENLFIATIINKNITCKPIIDSNQYRGFSFKEYDYVFIDDAEYVNRELLKDIIGNIKYQNDNTRILCTISKEYNKNVQENTLDFAEVFNDFELNIVVDEEYDKMIENIEKINENLKQFI